MHSIRSRLIWSILAGVLVLSLLAGAVLSYILRDRLVAEYDRGLESKARALVTLISLEDGRLEMDFDPESTPAFAKRDPEEGTERDRVEGKGSEYFALYLTGGKLLGKSPSHGERPAVAADFENPEERSTRSVKLPDGRAGRTVQLRFQPRVEIDEPGEIGEAEEEDLAAVPAGETRIDLVLVVAQERERLDAVLVSVYLAIGGTTVVLLAGIGVLVGFLVRRGLRPIDALNAQMTSIGPETLDERLSLDAPADELSGIVSALNGLLERVESGFIRERRFSSDVAHELRTPVAEVLTACEVGAKWPDDEAACRRLFEDVREAAKQMESIVETLLELARCENGAATVQTCAVPLRHLVEECWSHTNGRPEAKELTIENRISDSLTVESDPEKLKLIVQNLLDNAAAHGTPRSAVSCFASQSNGNIDLVFRNQATGLSGTDAGKVFDRFWQGDRARSAPGRFGLGLSIVKALATLLGHRVHADLTDDSVFEVRIQFTRDLLKKSRPLSSR